VYDLAILEFFSFSGFFHKPPGGNSCADRRHMLQNPNSGFPDEPPGAVTLSARRRELVSPICCFLDSSVLLMMMMNRV